MRRSSAEVVCEGIFIASLQLIEHQLGNWFELVYIERSGRGGYAVRRAIRGMCSVLRSLGLAASVLKLKLGTIVGF